MWFSESKLSVSIDKIIKSSGKKAELCEMPNIIVNYALWHLKLLPLEPQKKGETSWVL